MSIPSLEAYAALERELAAARAESAGYRDERDEARAHQTATAEVLKVIASSVEDTAPVFDKIVESCRRLFDTGQITIFMLDNVGNVGLIASHADLFEKIAEMFPRRLDDSVINAAMCALHSVHYATVAGIVNKPGDMREVYRHVGDHSVLVAPMVWEGRAIGAVLIARLPVQPFTESEIALLTTFADQAVIAIQNSKMFRETKEALERQTATAEVLRVISSSVANAEPVFEKILDSCERLFDTDHLAILLLRDNILHLGAMRGSLNHSISNLYPLSIDDTMSAVAIREGKTLHYPSIAAIEDMPRVLRQIYKRTGDESFAIAPMLWDGNGVGSLVIVRVPPRPFSDKELALLTTFADQAVIAIENARLFHEIEDKSHQLATANQHKSDFLANMSHELRTPLNAVIGFSEVLLERMFGELNEKQDDYLKDILSSGKHLLSLISDILDLSKIEAGRMELELEDFDVAAALSNTLTLIRERAQQHGIGLSLDVEPNIGEIRADQRKLKQIMLNLLSNAVKFTPDGGHTSVNAVLKGDVLEVAVTDTGIGIALEDQDTVFQEFRQVGGSYTNKQEGTGLGLALTRRFVELHGGSISLASVLGQGSTFTFTIPRQS